MNRLRATPVVIVTLCLTLLAIGLTSSVMAEPKPAVGHTRIARWKDDSKGVFLLMFDDSWPSHWQVAAPELAGSFAAGTPGVVSASTQNRATASSLTLHLQIKEGRVLAARFTAGDQVDGHGREQPTRRQRAADRRAFTNAQRGIADRLSHRQIGHHFG